MKKMKKFYVILLAAILSLNIVSPISVEAATKLTVSYIDVGQGDAILIQDGKTNTVIDTGEEDEFNKLSKYLDSKKVKTINNLIITHPDSDHMGGADLLMDKYKVKKIYMTKYKSKSKEYKEMLSEIKDEKVKRINVSTKTKINLGSVKAKVLSADTKAKNSNNSSIVLYVKHKSNSFLFMGDADKSVEKKVTQKYNINVDVLKVGHHGSVSSSTPTLLKEATPKYSIVSVGKNSYGHPNKSALSRLKKYSKKILRTDKSGTIVVTSNGKKLSYKTTKSTNNNTDTKNKNNTENKNKNNTENQTNNNTGNNNKNDSKYPSTVYITKTGSYFHKGKCGSGNYFTTSLTEALGKRLKPCSKCFDH